MLFRSVITLIFIVVTVVSFDVDFNFGDKSEVEEGKGRYAELLRKAETYGECWHSAMKDLHDGCGKLTEELQSRLALSFTYCFLTYTETGDPSRCEENVPVASCLKNSTDRVFHTYTEFYTHTQSICHFLLHRKWQEETAKTVLMLAETSDKVGKKLNDLSESQSQIQELQRSSISDQKKLILFGKMLNNQLLQSSSSARTAYNDFKMATDQQKHLLFEVFDRLKNLQNFVLGEFSGIYTVAYYIIAIISIYVATSVKRTMDARIWLILVICLCAVLERYLTSFSVEDILSLNPFESNELVFSRIWFCRKVSCALCVVILIAFYYQYTDYNKINNQLLKEIQMQNLELQKFMKGLSSTALLPDNIVFSIKGNHVVQETAKEIVSTPEISKGESSPSINVLRSPMSELNHKDVSGKENILATPLSRVTVAEHERTVRKKKLNTSRISTTEAENGCSIEKKRPNSKNTPKKAQQTPSLTPIALDEISSPGSPRYNLRSSSRLNSPASPALR